MCDCSEVSNWKKEKLNRVPLLKSWFSMKTSAQVVSACWTTSLIYKIEKLELSDSLLDFWENLFMVLGTGTVDSYCFWEKICLWDMSSSLPTNYNCHLYQCIVYLKIYLKEWC